MKNPPIAVTAKNRNNGIRFFFKPRRIEYEKTFYGFVPCRFVRGVERERGELDDPDSYKKLCEVCPYADESLCVGWQPDCSDELNCKYTTLASCQKACDGTCNGSGSCYFCMLSLSCPDNCKTCNISGKCTACDSGYTLSNGECVENVTCPANCTACSSSTTCTACASGYTLSGGKCVLQCPDNCTSCSSSTTCTVCASGYTLQNGKCVIKCPDNCAYCTSSSSCSTCKSGYTLSGGKCVKVAVATCPTGSTRSSDGCCCVSQ